MIACKKNFARLAIISATNMSSGFNGIPIRSVGRTRIKLAEMLNVALDLTGPDCIRPEDLKRTNPNHRCWEDCCAWDCWTRSKPKQHIYSWATMTFVVKNGFTITDKKSLDIEV